MDFQDERPNPERLLEEINEEERRSREDEEGIGHLKIFLAIARVWVRPMPCWRRRSSFIRRVWMYW